MVPAHKSHLSFLGGLILPRALGKKVHSTLPRARSLALNLFVEISSLVLILPLWPLASKGLLIVELGKGLKIGVGEQAYHTQSEIHNGKRETGKGETFLYR